MNSKPATAAAHRAATLLVLGTLLLGGSQPEESATLVLATGLDPRVAAGEEGIYGELLESALEDWQASHPELNVEVQVLSGNADHQRAQIGTVAESSEETYDIVSVDNQWVPEFAEHDWILPLDAAEVPPINREDFLDPWVRAVSYQGRLWAAPFLADVGLLYYRADLVSPDDLTTALEDEDPWSALLELAEESAEAAGVEAGYSGQFANYEGLTVNTLEIELNSGRTGPDALLPTGSDAACEADIAIPNDRLPGIDVLADHLDGAVPPDALNDTELSSLERFQAGESVFLRHWPYAYHVLDRGGPDEASPPLEDAPQLEPAGWNPREQATEPSFAVTEWPAGGVLGGQSFAVSSDSDHPNAAFDLIALLVDYQRQTELYAAGFAPALKQAHVEDPVEVDSEHARAAHDALSQAEQRPSTPYYQRVSHILSTHAHTRLSEGRWVGNLNEELNDALCGR